MTRYFIQITGISGIFFVLALGSSSEKVARYAIPFGLLIDISMLMYLFKKGAGDTITTDLGGTPASVQTAEEKARKAAYAEPHQPNEPFYVAPGIPIQGPQL
jgi:hypothetical protein